MKETNKLLPSEYLRDEIKLFEFKELKSNLPQFLGTKIIIYPVLYSISFFWVPKLFYFPSTLTFVIVSIGPQL